MNGATSFACAAEGASISASVLFSCFVTPAVFRLVPPDTAGRVFARLSRVVLFGAEFTAIAATILRAQITPRVWVPEICDAVACVVGGAALAALPGFERARGVAMREPGMGNSVDGDATLRSHRILSLIRTIALAMAVLVLAALSSSLIWGNT